MSPSDEDRRFSDEEVALILRRAADLDGRASPPARPGEGMSLAELQEIGTEAGIDPAHVEAAALALRAAPKAKLATALLGGPTTMHFETAVPGTLGREELQEMIAIVRRVLGRQGIVSTVLDSVEWKARDPSGSRYVSITPGKGTTRIRALGNLRDGTFLYHLAGGMMSVMGWIALLGSTGVTDALGLMSIPVIAAGSYLPVRTLWKWKTRKEERDLEETVTRLAEYARSAGGGGTSPARSEASPAEGEAPRVRGGDEPVGEALPVRDETARAGGVEERDDEALPDGGDG